MKKRNNSTEGNHFTMLAIRLPKRHDASERLAFAPPASLPAHIAADDKKPPIPQNGGLKTQRKANLFRAPSAVLITVRAGEHNLLKRNGKFDDRGFSGLEVLA